MLISTISLNPAVDRTYYVDAFTKNALNRAWKTKTNIGGKGTNISAIARICGYESIAGGFLAGGNGRYIEETLTNMGVKTDFVYTKGETRVNVKIVDIDAGSFTDINDCGPAPDEANLKDLFGKVESIAAKSDFVHFGGSIHPDIDQGIYKELIAIASAAGAKTVLDAGGEALSEGILSKPDIIKPNQLELELMLGRKLKTIPEVGAAAKEIMESGVETVLVSLGGNGAIGADKSGIYRAFPLNVAVKSTVGAGDSFLFGYLHGIMQNRDIITSLRYAVSFSAAKIQLEGTDLPGFESFCELKDTVLVEKI
jgi:1-phosphofructokinase